MAATKRTMDDVLTPDEINSMMTPYIGRDKEGFEKARDAVIDAKFDLIQEVAAEHGVAPITREQVAFALGETCHDAMLEAIKETMLGALAQVFGSNPDVQVVTDPAEISRVMRGDAPLH